jgi:hypothetical protein
MELARTLTKKFSYNKFVFLLAVRANGSSPERHCYVGMFIRYPVWCDICVVLLVHGRRVVLCCVVLCCVVLCSLR